MNEFDLITIDNNELTTSNDLDISTDSSYNVNIIYNDILIGGENITPPVEIVYNGSVLGIVNAGETKALVCGNKLMSGDVIIRPQTFIPPVPEGENLTVTQVYGASQSGSSITLS